MSVGNEGRTWFQVVAYLASALWIGLWGWLACLPYCYSGCPGSPVPVILWLGTLCLLTGLPVILNSVIRGVRPGTWARVAVLLISAYGVAVGIEWAYAAFVIRAGQTDLCLDLVPATSPLPFMATVIVRFSSRKDGHARRATA